jgi:hypothetical protein
MIFYIQPQFLPFLSSAGITDLNHHVQLYTLFSASKHMNACMFFHICLSLE